MKTNKPKLKERFCQFLEVRKERAVAQRQGAMERLASASLTSFFFRWLLTNWITILLLIFLVVAYLGYNYHLDYLQEAADRNRIEELNRELLSEKERTKILKEKIEDLSSQVETDRERNKQVTREVEVLSAKEKRRLLLQYRDRLMRKRGLRKSNVY